MAAKTCRTLKPLSWITVSALVATSSVAGCGSDSTSPTPIANVNSAPVFSSSTTFAVSEGDVSAFTAQASDPEGSSLTYSLSGADAELFNIDTSTGVVTFINTPDFEVPSDTGADNIYNLTISASDGTNTSSQNVTVTVTDIEEIKIIDVETLSASDGFRISDISGGGVGTDATNLVGYSTSIIGDINGDGFDDFMLGAPGTNRSSTEPDIGETYVIYGTNQPFGTSFEGRQTFDLETLNADKGFVIRGENNFDQFGSSVSAAGDFNNDGFDDFIVAAADSCSDDFLCPQDGYVIFGTDEDYGVDVEGRQILDIASLTSAQGFVISNVWGDAAIGESMSPAGDINDDGFDDIIVGGEESGDDWGGAYVIFGTDQVVATNSAGNQNLPRINRHTLTASVGFFIYGEESGNRAGRSVSSAGDMNGDGIDDIMISAPFSDYSSGRGEVYVLFGTDQDIGSQIEPNIQGLFLSDISAGNHGAQGFVIIGDTDGDEFGRALSSAGDVNGDGFDDIIIGAPYGDDGGENAGEAYVIFGASQIGTVNNSGQTSIEVTSLTPAQGFIIQGDQTGEPVVPGNSNTALLTAFNTGDVAGYSVSGIGDINADGFDEVAIGAYAGDDGGPNNGEVYIIFGTDQAFGTLDDTDRSVIDLTDLGVTEGLIIQGAGHSDGLGRSISAGNIDGDNVNDLLIGAGIPGEPGGPVPGGVYVIYGSTLQ